VPVPVDQLLPFAAASILITVIPGADMALVTRQVLLGGTRLAQQTIAGNVTGICVHGIALAVGLSAIVVASATAYTAVKLAGAAYLLWLGMQALRAARRPGPGAAAGERRPVPTRRRAYTQGLVSTVLNPKPALFFLTFLPQFVDEHHAVLGQIAFLAAIHVLVGFVWLSLYARLVARAHGALVRAEVRRRLEALTGALLIGLGLRVAVER
jgi:threonine/homoserine/homoserine lactone efflux protein